MIIVLNMIIINMYRADVQEKVKIGASIAAPTSVFLSSNVPACRKLLALFAGLVKMSMSVGAKLHCDIPFEIHIVGN